LGTAARARVTAAAAQVIFSIAFGAALLAVGATPAAAHTALKSSNPKNGARLSAAPEAIELTFTEPLRAQLTKVVIRGPGDEQFESGLPQVTSDTVTQPLGTLNAAGKYQIVFRVVAADGHPLTGTVRFTLTPAEPSPAATTGTGVTQTLQPVADQSVSDDDVSPWVLAIAVVALVACVTGAVFFGRRVTRGLD
jgi:methionine-rich copper-binding protein CopC